MGGGSRKFLIATKEEKENVFLQLREIILKLDQKKLIDEFSELFCGYSFDVDSYGEQLCLSWNMIKEMANSSYCTIAAHTVNHRTLNLLSDEELKFEVLYGRKVLEEKIGKPVTHFAYPFGTYNEIGEREIEFVKNGGFDTACYSFGGNILKKNIVHLHKLPRVFLGELHR
jgi:hypothetical protein